MKKNTILERIQNMWYRQSKKTTHTGAMLAIFLDENSGKKLVINNTNKQIITTEPLKNLHITLFYFPDDKKLNKNTCNFIKYIVSQIHTKYNKLTAEATGIGMFADKKDNNTHTLYASINSPTIVELRNELAKIFDNIGIEYSKEFNYTPHITLANTISIPDIEIPNFNVNLESIALCINDSKRFEIKI